MGCIFWVLSCYYFIIILSNGILGLKCRTGNQQSDEQMSKIMSVCRRRYQGYDRETGYNNRDTDSQESSDSDSSEELFDNRFLTGGGSNRYRGNNNNGRDYNNQQSRSPSSSSSSSMYNNQNGRNWRTMSNGNGGNGMNNGYDYMGSSRGSMYSLRSVRSASGGLMGYNSRGYSGGSGSGGYDSQGSYGSSSSGRYGSNSGSGSRSYYGNGSGSGNGNGNYNSNDDDDERERACIIQCFFNELNLVDQRGYPERSAVTGIMIRNIQDPELRDFVEESIYECYHYLNNSGRQEKCEFSQNLLTCLADKGSERCEDWEDE